ncbi:MAG: hypothetical protein GF398_01100 [Chitinivibrionales bacterium]|nr:hypothetical protein [Chitinivibrionales bacterium]
MTRMSNPSAQPELLAPAGTLESFHAALDAGANAVYLGVQDFNARIRAKNFSLKTLTFVVPYAHKQKVKVYVTFNTLIKQSELKAAVEILDQLGQIGVDAVIVQDLGIVEIVKRHLPKLKLHGSTQMAIHNSAGVDIAEELGLQRAILARELTMREIERISQKTSLELEVFVHGALCYSFSGMCLASSYLGGMSGNRGRCTQVCRRHFDGQQQGRLFSPKDLSTIEMIPRIAKVGIKSLKIEGRLKGAEYIHAVVSAYRRAIDNPEQIPEFVEELKKDFGREKTPLFMHGVQQEGIIQSGCTAGTGIYLGRISGVTRDAVFLPTREPVEAGDTIRIQPSGGMPGRSCKVVNSSTKGGILECVVSDTAQMSVNDAVHLTGRKSSVSGASVPKIHVKPAKCNQRIVKASAIAKQYNQQRQAHHKPLDDMLYVKVDALEWLYLLNPEEFSGVMLACDVQSAGNFIVDSRLLNLWGDKIIVCLPPFIAQSEMHVWREMVAKLASKGISRLCASNIGQLAFIEKPLQLWTDYLLWSMNAAAHQVYSRFNAAKIACSFEDDLRNLKRLNHKKTLCYLFASAPLFISRIKPDVAEDVVVSNMQDSFFVARRYGLYYLVGGRPMSLMHKRDTLHELGITNFVIDLSFMTPRKKSVRAVVKAYHQKAKIPESVMFNFKRGLV